MFKKLLNYFQVIFTYEGRTSKGGGGRFHNLENGKEASEVTEEIPAGCAGEGKQKKGN